MGTRLIMSCLLVAGFIQQTTAQKLEEGQRRGLVQANASLYPAFMLNHPIQNNYVAGHTTYYFHDKYSFRGEALAYIDAQKEVKYLSRHYQVEVGFGRHFPVKRWDPFIYYTMGLASVRLQTASKNYVQPTIGIIVGLHYNVNRFFHFFAEGHYGHMQDPGREINLDQIYVSGGLGFQLPTRNLGKNKNR